MSRDALTISTYPFPIIRIVCAKCARSGQYCRQTLIDRFGPDTGMPEVLEELAQCPNRRNYPDICQVRCPDPSGRCWSASRYPPLLLLRHRRSRMFGRCHHPDLGIRQDAVHHAADAFGFLLVHDELVPATGPALRFPNDNEHAVALR